MAKVAATLVAASRVSLSEAFVLIAACVLSMAASAKEPPKTYDIQRPSETCLVVGVMDGDTINVRCGAEGDYRQVTLRLAEIDAPEKKQDYGQRSKENLSDLCFKAQTVVTPQVRDKYGRTVARVSCNGQDASLHQVKSGLAWWYVKYGTDLAIKEAEKAARSRRQGLWASSREPMPPWEFRHPTPSTTPAMQRIGSAPASTCHIGPRGGRYTITASGGKNYGGC